MLEVALTLLTLLIACGTIGRFSLPGTPYCLPVTVPSCQGAFPHAGNIRLGHVALHELRCRKAVAALPFGFPSRIWGCFYRRRRLFRGGEQGGLTRPRCCCRCAHFTCRAECRSRAYQNRGECGRRKAHVVVDESPLTVDLEGTIDGVGYPIF